MRIIRAIINILMSSKGRKGRQRALASLMAVVVFCTTYTLILPAITLDRQTAESEPGIEAETAAEETLGEVQDADLLLAGQNEEVGETEAADPETEKAVEAPAETEKEVSAPETDAADSISETEEVEPEGELETETEEVYAKSPLIYHCDQYDIELRFDSDEWQLPEDTVLSVKELHKDAEEDSEEYLDYHYYDDRAKEELADQDEALAERADVLHFYELQLKAEGEELSMPEGEADITIKYNPNDKSDYNSKEFGDGEKVLASLFWNDKEDTLLFDENWDESDVITLKNQHLNKVYIKDLGLSDFDNVIGLYVCPPEKKVTLKAEGSDYSVTAVCGQKSGVPEDAKLTVSEIKPGSEEYEQYLDSAREALGEEKENEVPAVQARFFDIKIMVDGKEFTPEAEIDVKIDFHEPVAIEQMQDVNAVHFGEEGTEVLDVTTEESKEGIENVSFTADSFSVYGVVYTVDFEYSVNGKMYQFSLPGGGFVSFTDLVEVLGITGDTNSEEDGDENGSVIAGNAGENVANEGAEENGINSVTNTVITLGDVEVSEATRKFVADVASVEFSSPELVDVSKVDAETTVGKIKENRRLECEYSADLTEEQIAEINAQTVEAGDWALISVQPFLSDETLTVTMKSGDQFVVKVTDAQIHKTVIDAKGDTWEITVTYGPDAQIPDGAELEVRVIDEETPNYTVLLEAMEEELSKQDKTLSTIPALFDISIVVNGVEVEPAPNSKVRVEAKLLRDSMGGIFSEENSAVQINDEPLTEENSTVEAHLCVIHAKNDGVTELMSSEEELSITDVASSFTTDSFSDWLIYLDEDLQSITVGVDDTITLRPYSSWVWKSDAELQEYIGKEWDFSDTNVWQRGNEIRGTRHHPTEWHNGRYEEWDENNAVIGYEYTLKNYVSEVPGATVQYLVYEKYDSQLKEWYNVAYGYANGPGEYDLKTTTPNPKTVHVTVVGDVRDVPPVITNTANIAVNLFNYDNTENHVLDVSDNTANSVIDQNINVGHDLKFLGWGYSGDTNNVNAYTQDHARQGNVESTLRGGDYPYLNAGSHESLAYLFDTSANSESVKGYANVQGLFQQDANGYYYYNSNINYAWFDETKNRFVLYEHTFSQNTEGTHEQTGSSVNAKPIGFFPFHRYDAPLSDATHSGMNHNILLDHHFGMSMQVDFTLPADRMLNSTDHIIYEFSGDDDLWVFVDNELVLDIGGIHQPVRGYIDFTDGEVYVYGVNNGQPQVIPFVRDLSTGTKHTLRMFYIERGGCDSNLSVKFNLPLTVGNLTFTKTDVNRPEEGLKGAVFGLYSDEACTHLVTTATSSDVEGHFGEVTFTDVPLGTTGIYYMKEIESPKGYVASTDVYRVILVDKTDTEHKSTISWWNPVTEQWETLDSIPNTPDYTELTVQKNWIGDPSLISDGANVTVTIKRYKLVSNQQSSNPQEEPKGFIVIGQMLADNGATEHPEYFKVDYVIKKGGEVVRTGSYTGTAGATIADLEPGTDYSVEAVCSSTNSEYYVGNAQQNRTGIEVKALDTTTVVFTNTLTKEEMKETKYHVRVMSKDNESDDTNDGSWPNADYPEGTRLRLTWQCNHDPWGFQDYCEYYDGSAWRRLNQSSSWSWSATNNSWNYDFGPLTQDTTIKLRNTYSAYGTWTAAYNWLNAPTLQVINPVTNASAQGFASTRRLALNARATMTNSGGYPDAPEGYTIDTTSEDVLNWSKTVTLPDSDQTPWTAIVEELEKVDLDGSIYVYYIDSVEETGMPEGTVVEIDLNGDKKQVVLGNQETPGTLSLTNTLAGDLKITKTVQKNGETDTSATGTFYYAVYTEPYNSASPQTPTRSGSITVSSNGTGSYIEEHLPYGTYYVYELTGQEGTPITDGSAVFGGKFYTVTVNGSPATVSESTPTVALINNYETISIDATKEWQNASGVTMTPDEGTTVTFDLYIGDTAQNKQVVLNGKTDVASEDDLSEDVTIAVKQEVNPTQVAANAYEKEPWKAYWGDLPKNDTSGQAISYVVKEVEGSLGFENMTPGGVSSGGSIINKQIETEINILKVDNGNTPTPLTGAKFVLEKYNSSGQQLLKTWPEEEVSSEEGKEGTLKFEGLTVGKYKLKETKSPDGYILASQAPEFEVKVEDGELKVDFTDTSMVTYNKDDNLFTVKNEPGTALPMTGGPGTRLFTILGSILILGAGLLLWRRRSII